MRREAPSTPSSVVPQRVQAAKDAAYRVEILDAAEEAFAASGYVETGVRDVAAVVGVSLTTLYRYFPGKLDLYRGVHRRRLDDLMSRVASEGKQPREPVGRMLAGLRHHLVFHMEHPAYLRMHLREGVSWANVRFLRTEEQIEAWHGGYARMSGTFARGIAHGVFGDDDPDLLTRTTLALMEAHLSWWVETGMDLAPQALCRKAFSRFVSAFCVGDARAAWLGRIERGDLP